MTVQGGAAGNGTIFKMNADGTGFTVLKSFNAGRTNASGVYTNNDGTGPQGRLLLSDETLYGTASAGGLFGLGTVFKINTNGDGFSVIKTLTGGLGAETASAMNPHVNKISSRRGAGVRFNC